MGKRKVIGVSLSEDTLRDLEELSNDLGIGISETVRWLIRMAKVLATARFKQLFPSGIWRTILKDERFCEDNTLMELIKPIPKLERELKLR